jgi:antitoxin (DNA-binding transcriptional repressor) of toxin-antitoxin stability system
MEQSMSAIPIAEAQAHLMELIGRLAPGEHVLITQEDRPVAQLVGLAADWGRPIPGRCRGMLKVIAEDEEHLKDFAEYMP